MNHEGHEGSRRKAGLQNFAGSFGQFLVLRLLAAYKWAVSPLLLPSCRYVPTCSDYAIEAVERYGAVRGGLMALLRLLRCHPFAHGGYDPVVKAAGKNFPQALKPTLISSSLRGPEGPLFHGGKGPLFHGVGGFKFSAASTSGLHGAEGPLFHGGTGTRDLSAASGSIALPNTIAGGNGASGTVAMSRCNHAKTSRIT